MGRDYRYISGDGHMEWAPERWTHRVDKRYQDRAPRRIKLADGRDAVVMEGRALAYSGTGLYGAGPPEAFNPSHLDFDGTPGTGDAEERLSTQDKDGIDAEILFGPLEARNTAVKDRNAFLALIQGCNDAMAEYCAVAPDRLIGVPWLPNIGIEDDLAEMQRCVNQLGFKTVRLSAFPNGREFPTEKDDRFWAAAVDMDLTLCVHTSGPGRYDRRNSLLDYSPTAKDEDLPRSDPVERMARHGIFHSGAVGAAQFAASGIFERFPKLRVYWAENNIGWIPYFYEQIDREYQTNRFWAERFLGLKPLRGLPSEYLREQAYWGFFEDPVGVRMRHDVGIEHILWSTDFPHEVSRWPRSIETLQSYTGDVPEDELRKMTAGNAMKLFHLGQTSEPAVSKAKALTS